MNNMHTSIVTDICSDFTAILGWYEPTVNYTYASGSQNTPKYL